MEATGTGQVALDQLSAAPPDLPARDRARMLLTCAEASLLSEIHDRPTATTAEALMEAARQEFRQKMTHYNLALVYERP